jgi:hypothetical protein
MAGYMESDHDYVMNNFELCIQMLDDRCLQAGYDEAKKGKRARKTSQDRD